MPPPRCGFPSFEKLRHCLTDLFQGLETVCDGWVYSFMSTAAPVRAVSLSPKKADF